MDPGGLVQELEVVEVDPFRGALPHYAQGAGYGICARDHTWRCAAC